MLNQWPAPDPKSKLNISSFLALPYPIDCFICAKDIMIIVLLLQMMGGWEAWGWFIKTGFEGQGGGCHIFSVFCSVVMLLVVL